MSVRVPAPMAGMKPGERRLAALVLLAIVLAGLYFLLLHWWFVAPLRDVDEQIDALRATQARYAATIAQKRPLQQRLATLGAGQAASTAFLPESDPNAAAAGLMQRTVTIAAAHSQGGNCEIDQKIPVADPPMLPGDPYQKVAVNIFMHCSMQPLVAVLHDIEQDTPYLFVDALTIFHGPLAPGASASLQVQMTVSGYLRQPRRPATAGAAP